MEKIVYLNLLFDLYGELLTDKQQKYFRDYYFLNLSYGEIANKYGISRNAVYHQLSLIENKLNFYEEKLNLCSKKDKVSAIINLIDNKEAKRILENLF